MGDESKMCFMTVANRPYQKYIPWFLYFLNRAYPKAHKLILLDGKIRDSIRHMLPLVSGNFEVREHAFQEYTKIDGNTIKCLRWLIFEPEFEQYDCMSIGDIDIAVYREFPSYMDQHLSHCNQLEIPYSNFMRNTKPERVCGIHVIKPREWFVAVRPTIDKYRSALKSYMKKLRAPGINEQLLLKIIVESSLGKPPPNLSKTYQHSLISSAHHGTHIRLAEHSGNGGIQGVKGYQTHKQEILTAVQTQLFQQLDHLSPKIGNLLRGVADAYRKF